MYFFALCFITAFGQNGFIKILPLTQIQVVYSVNTSLYYTFSGRIDSQTFDPSMKIFNDVGYNYSASSYFPDDRCMYGMAIDSSGLIIYIYGGLGKKGVYGDMWKYFVINDTFQQIIQSGVEISSRYNMQFAYYTHNTHGYIVLLGGLGATDNILSDFYM